MTNTSTSGPAIAGTVPARKKGSWETAEFYVEGEKILQGLRFGVLAGRESVITIKAAGITQLNLMLVNAGNLNVTASPEFGSLLPLINGVFQCVVTPQAGRKGNGTFVFYSPDVDEVLEFDFNVPDALFTFEDSSLKPLPVPPEKFLLPAGTPVVRIVANLTDFNDVPLANVSGTFFHPDMEPHEFTTSPSGRLHFAVVNHGYPSGFIFTPKAVAELPEGNVVIGLIVEVQ